MNIIKELTTLKQKVGKLFCLLEGMNTGSESDPTVPDHVKAITVSDIDNWNNTIDSEVILTESSDLGQIGESQQVFNKGVVNRFVNIDYNIAGLQTALDTKVTKPSTTVTDTTAYTHALLVDANGNAAKYLAGDLGKNIANSNLITTVLGGITQAFNYVWDTAGFQFRLTGLPDKSTDVTFNKLLGKNTAGQVVETNGYVALDNMLLTATPTQRAVIRQRLADGSTSNIPQVDIIVMPVIKKQTGIQYLTLYGLNLNFSQVIGDTSMFIREVATGTDIQITNASWDVTTGRWVIIPFDFSVLNLGSHKIRIVHKGIEFTTSQSFNVVNTITPVDYSDNIWQIKTYNDIPNANTNSNFNTINYVADSAVNTPAPLAAILLTATSKVLCTMADNFLIELTDNTNPLAVVNGNHVFSTIGICHDITSNLLDTIILGLTTNLVNSRGNYFIPGKSLEGAYGTAHKLIIQKYGSVISCVFISTVGSVAYVGTTTDNTSNVRVKLLVKKNNYINTVKTNQILNVIKY